jgi:UDP-glucose 4-epimerase
MEKVLITGVAGFIGSHVARRFVDRGWQVVGVDDLSQGSRANVPTEVEFICGDLSQTATIASIPRGCSRILHLAGQSSGEISFDDPVADLQKNAVSTLNLVQYGIANRCERIVYASSMSVYGAVPAVPINEDHACAPLSCYGVGKLAAEGYLRVYAEKLPFVALRMFNVYGPGQDMSNLRQGMVSIYLAQALAGGPVEVKGGLDRFRDFIYIDDVVDAWENATLRSAALGETVNVGTGIKTSVGELLDRICTLVPGANYYVSGGTPGDQNGIYADTARLRGILEVQRCIGLDEGLTHFVRWARRNPIRRQATVKVHS